MVPQQVSFVERSSLSQRVPYWRFHCICEDAHALCLTYVSGDAVNSEIDETSTCYPNNVPSNNVHFHAGIDDLFLVSSELLPVAHRWKNIGLALKLDPNLLERIQSRNHRDVLTYLSDILTEWLQKAYNTTRFGDPSWELLVEAVAHRAGGNNPALAQDIALKYNGKQHC